MDAVGSPPGSRGGLASGAARTDMLRYHRIMRRWIWWGILAAGCGSTVGVTGDPTPVPHCADKARNADETDVDCGGSCGPCDGGKHCVQFTDCKSQVCNGGSCVAQCADQTKDGDETDVDCGGSCDKCTNGKKCSAATDCESGTCSAGTCSPAPTCMDNLKNGSETDLDCGGSACGKCADGKTCKLDGDCKTANCSGGVCCGPSLGNCDGNAMNSCEANLDSDPKNCGKCRMACGAADAACSMGKCQPQLLIKVEGHADVPVACQKADYACEAKQICEKITGFPCVFQQYDCYLGTQAGSYYPLDGTGGMSAFNFAFSYDFSGPNNDFGNICACDPAILTKYGLGSQHTKCGYGHWYRQ
jgi:hypothetical protein